MKYSLNLTLDEMCDLLIATDLQEKNYLELADRDKKNVCYDYFVKKASNLHNIGDRLFYKIFGYERGDIDV